jgi:nitroreductase
VTATTLTDADLVDLVGAAVRAPSIHNTQPWLFRLRDGAIEVLADQRRWLPVTDPTRWAMRMSCGAALFNLRLALAMRGTPAEVRLRPSPRDVDLLARLTLGQPRPASPEDELLYAAIHERRSSREPFWPDPVPAQVRARLVAAARAEGAWLELLIGREPVAALAEIAQAADRVLARIPGYLDELSSWTRRDTDPDGVPASAGGPSPEPQDLLPQRPFGAPRAPGRDYESEPLVAVLGTAGDAPVDQLAAGQALQRVLLTATDSGLATSMLSQPIEVASAREQLRLALGRFGAPQMVLRIGYGQPGSPTPRRDPNDVIVPSSFG